MIEELVRKHALAVEDLTEKQLAEAIQQAIACGDFQRLVVTGRDGEYGQQVVYIPFREHERLQARIKELVEELRIERGRCKACGEIHSPHIGCPVTGN